LTISLGEASSYGGLHSGRITRIKTLWKRKSLTVHRYPELVTHVFSVCTPYTAPHKEYLSTEDLVKNQLPQFAYQLHLASGEVEKVVNDEHSIRQFLKGMYGGRGPNGEIAFDPCKGVLADNLPSIGDSKLLNGKVRSNFYCPGPIRQL
jgi:hypothetical protein